mmetsp:Transcript_26524/g.66715  ORF Transcript_26524/g.66715 Transcript_26524/m.66715 type:complete len:305 (-) Transcript_26524:124-1038(-)
MPWDLWTLTAQASSRGSCTLVPRTFEPERASKHSGATATATPESPKDTMGCFSRPAPAKLSTMPCDPFTSLRRTLIVRVSSTSAPTRSSTARRAPLSASSSSGSPSSTAWKVTNSPGKLANARAFTHSTSERSGINLVTARSPLPSQATSRSRNKRSDSAESSPKRTSFRTRQKASSPFCLKTSVSSKVLVTVRRHAATSKQKGRGAEGSARQESLGEFRAQTGGSCRKSPVRTSCKPPNGSSQPRTARASTSSLAKSAPSTMETSSMTSVRVRRHLCRASRLPRSFRASATTSSSPRPTAAHL